MSSDDAATPPRRQCKTCPWKKGASVDAIPNYAPEQHLRLTSTIAEPGSLAGLGRVGLRVMACHHSSEGADLACVGWLEHQLGPGNNIALRLRALSEPGFANVATEGPQHERFEDTLPKRRGKTKAR